MYQPTINVKEQPNIMNLDWWRRFFDSVESDIAEAQAYAENDLTPQQQCEVLYRTHFGSVVV